jgi:hypothetical protein
MTARSGGAMSNRSREAAQPPVTVVARCVFCKHEAEMVPPSDAPICPKCFSPMVVMSATARATPVPSSDGDSPTPLEREALRRRNLETMEDESERRDAARYGGEEDEL